MKIICKNTRNIIIAVAFVCICLVGAETAEAGCYLSYQVIRYESCPVGKSLQLNYPQWWPPSALRCNLYPPYNNPIHPLYNERCACFPCGGYACMGGGGGLPFGTYCANNSGYGGCEAPGSHPVYNWVWRCDGDCNNSILYACTTPNSLIASIGPKTDDASYWYWYCPGNTYGINSSRCQFSKEPIVNGSCQTFPSGVDPLPTASNQLCATGTASAVSGLGTYEYPWTWTCFGSSGGADDPSCSAKKPCEYTEYKCTRSSADVTCEDTYPENCEKILPVNKICHATDRFNSCPPLSQSDCKAAAGSSDCDNTTETCASCPINPGAWREVSPQN
ncbi:MAG TPA: hypothetical protein P5323_02780 [Candidatus Moranbacteria bacterium]|nr:hypothetical protein [Candidatus Moranbacteria bacterium]